MIVSKEEADGLPSYSGAQDGFSFSPDKKEEHPTQPETAPSSSSSPPIFPTYYAPAPFSHSEAPTASSSGTITPLAFSRPRAQGPGFTYAQFKPMFLLASSNKSTSLSKGFPMSPPPSKEDPHPHPFVTHDINEIDWLQFMDDVRAAGSLTQKDIQRSYLPIVSWVPFVGDLSAYGVQKFMKSRKSSTVAKTLDTWNHHFFEPRKIRIVLMRGNTRLSGLHDRTMGELHTPEPVNVSSGILENAIGSGKGKGKSKEEVDEIYRLFVLSI